MLIDQISLISILSGQLYDYTNLEKYYHILCDIYFLEPGMSPDRITKVLVLLVIVRRSQSIPSSLCQYRYTTDIMYLGLDISNRMTVIFARE